ncbi:hypothetical protein ADEAN_000244800 [Angomonas deanei]|uniref:Uncharacterized protein n=1 Tax=Angomonas deanei TaxID=59799 RepID=A0A7G2C6A0_9TRYP|nr:hypothetical protein ADEAN_000244800 [Angomonas deanei]
MSTKPVSNKPVKAPQVDAAPDISKTKAPRTSTHSKDVRGKEETKAASSVVKREKPVVASKPAHKDPVKGDARRAPTAERKGRGKAKGA